MNRFSRYSRISPLELCLEAERRAWRVGLALWGIFLALAVGALFLRVPGDVAHGNESDFCGVQVEVVQAEEVVRQVVSAPLPPMAAVELPELASRPELLPFAVDAVECELPEVAEEEDCLCREHGGAPSCCADARFRA